MADDRRQRYESYIAKAKANDWQDQVEHWQTLLEGLDDDYKSE